MSYNEWERVYLNYGPVTAEILKQNLAMQQL